MQPLLPLSLAAALLCAACSTTSPLEKAERTEREENTRVVESRRMRALDYGDVGSERGAEMLVVDKYKAFNLASAVTGSSKSYSTGSANVKDFNYEQKVTTRSYNAGKFWGAKQSAFSDQRYATKSAKTTGNYEIPNATKMAGTKTAATKDARESDLTMAVRTLPDGSRQFLGKENAKIGTPVDPKEAANWRGASAMVTTGGEVGSTVDGRRYVTPVERIGQMKEISIGELRELLNKNK